MGLDLTFYKTKDIYNEITPVIYKDNDYTEDEAKNSIIFEDFEKKVIEIYYLRNNYQLLTYLISEYGQIKNDKKSYFKNNELNDCIVKIKESDILNIKEVIKNKHWTDKDETHFIDILKKSIVHNSILIHISY